jgi:hypothetical protein
LYNYVPRPHIGWRKGWISARKGGVGWTLSLVLGLVIE